MTKRTKLFLLFLFIVINISAQEFAIIPKPLEISIREGRFILDKSVTIQFDDSKKEVSKIAGFFSEYIENMYDIKFENTAGEKTIQFKIISSSNL